MKRKLTEKGRTLLRERFWQSTNLTTVAGSLARIRSGSDRVTVDLDRDGSLTLTLLAFWSELDASAYCGRPAQVTGRQGRLEDPLRTSG